MLAPMVADDGAAPISCRRLPRLVDQNAIVCHRLRVIVGQMLAVDKLLVSRAGIQGQKTSTVDDEVEGVVMAVLAQGAATGEQTIRVVRPRAGAYENLAHRLEMSSVGRVDRTERFRRRLRLGQKERVDKPCFGVRLLWDLLLDSQV